MTLILNVATILLLLVGAGFLLAGTIGFLRFPDAQSRLHALSKADNISLGFIALGLSLQADSLIVGIKIMMIWCLALLASAFTCGLIANRELANARRNTHIRSTPDSRDPIGGVEGTL